MTKMCLITPQTITFRDNLIGIFNIFKVFADTNELFFKSSQFKSTFTESAKNIFDLMLANNLSLSGYTN